MATCSSNMKKSETTPWVYPFSINKTEKTLRTRFISATIENVLEYDGLNLKNLKWQYSNVRLILANLIIRNNQPP